MLVAFGAAITDEIGTEHILAIFSKLTFLRLAKNCAIILTFSGKFCSPRTGDKYGESVSSSIFSSGIFFANSCKFLALEKVTLPANET